MKVLHCLSNFLPYQVAGTEIYVASLCKELQLLGVEAIVVNPSFGQTPKDYIYEGIPVKQYAEPSVSSDLFQMGLQEPEGVKNFIALLYKEKPDVIHFHETSGSTGITIYHVLAVKKMGIPLFTTFHLSGNICMRNSFLFKGKQPCNGEIKEYKCAVCMLEKKHLHFGIPEMLSFLGHHFKNNISHQGIGKFLNYPLYVRRHAQNLNIVNNASIKMFVLSEWYKKLLVLNGVDGRKIIVLQAAFPKLTNEILSTNKVTLNQLSVVKFVYVGRIAQIKGLHIMIAAFLALQKQNWTLDIFGQASEQKYYEDCRKQSANNPSIRWCGTLNNQNIVLTLSAYDALLFPSIVQETAGLVMFEAFSAGIPVVGSSIWTVQEHVLDGENGFIFRANDASSLNKTLVKILKDPSILNEMRKNISPPYLMEDVASNTLKFYKEVLVK